MKKFFMQALPLTGGNMKNDNLAPCREVNEQWLMNTYLREFVSLKVYAIRIINNEIEAENIVGKCFAKLARKLEENPNKFSSPAHAKASLITVIRNDCCSWLRKKLPVNAGEPAECIMDEHHLVLEFEKQDLLQHLLPQIDQLPAKLKEVAILCFKEGLTSEEVEQRLHLNKEVLRVYKARAVTRLREMVHSGKEHCATRSPLDSKMLTPVH